MTSSSTDFEAEVERNYKHNFTVNLLDGTFYWFGSSFIAVRTILPLYVSRLTDSTLAIGLLATIASAGWLLPQLFTANWVQRLPVKKVIAVRFGFFSERLPVMLLAPGAWLATRSPGWALIVFFIVYTWLNIGAGAVAVAWQDMIAKVFPLATRGKFFGITNFSGTATGVLGAAAAAWALATYEFPYSYMICFAAAAIFMFISWVFLAMTREPAQISPEPEVSQREYWQRLPAILRTDLNFRRYLFSQIVITMGGMSIGFLAVYAVKQWQLPDSQAGAFTVSMLIGQALSNLVFGWLADRKGHKLVLELSTLAVALGIGLAYLATAPAWFHIVFALIGISSAGFILSGIMIMFEFSKPEVRPTYIGLINTIIGSIAIFTPMIGGWLADTAGYQALFLVSFTFSIAGLAMLRWWVREPRRVASGG